MGSPSAHNGSSKGRVGSIPTATTINNAGYMRRYKKYVVVVVGMSWAIFETYLTDEIESVCSSNTKCGSDYRGQLTYDDGGNTYFYPQDVIAQFDTFEEAIPLRDQLIEQSDAYAAATKEARERFSVFIKLVTE